MGHFPGNQNVVYEYLALDRHNELHSVHHFYCDPRFADHYDCEQRQSCARYAPRIAALSLQMAWGKEALTEKFSGEHGTLLSMLCDACNVLTFNFKWQFRQMSTWCRSSMVLLSMPLKGCGFFATSFWSDLKLDQRAFSRIPEHSRYHAIYFQILPC